MGERFLVKYLVLRYLHYVHIITRRKLDEFALLFPKAKGPLDAWYKVLSKQNFKSLPEIKAVMPATDYVGGVQVFDIGGNKYRLIAKIEYRWQKVFILDVLTHAAYDDEKWKKKKGGKA